MLRDILIALLFGVSPIDLSLQRFVVAEQRQEIPVLDLNDFLSADQEQFVQQLGDALHEIGFVRIKHHQIRQEYIDQALASAGRFFDLPLETKQQYQGLEKNLGYKGFDPKRKDKTSDLQEYWHVGPATNVWPAEIDRFEADLSLLYEDIAEQGDVILQACSLYMGKERYFLSDLTTEGDSIMRVIHYLPSEGNTTWKAAHRDPNLLTIIVGASMEGLQVQTREGVWVDVPYDPETIVISSSNMLESLSNGLMRSAPHRVVIPASHTSRFSIPFFYHPKRDQSIAPQEECIRKTGGEALYPDQTAAEALKDHPWFRK